MRRAGSDCEAQPRPRAATQCISVGSGANHRLENHQGPAGRGQQGRAREAAGPRRFESGRTPSASFLPEAAPAVLNGTPLLSGTLSGAGRREFAVEASWDLPSLAAGTTALLDVSVLGARVGDLANASLATSSRFFELDATAWSNNTIRVLARDMSNTTIDLAAATLSVQVAKRRSGPGRRAAMPAAGPPPATLHLFSR